MGGNLEIRCELGPLVVGRSWFRNIQVLPISAPTAHEPVIDLELLGPARMPPPAVAAKNREAAWRWLWAATASFARMGTFCVMATRVE